MSKFKVWIDIPENQIEDATMFANDAQRIAGFQPKTTISSVLVNSALRQANLVAAALMEAVNAPDNITLSSSVEEVKQVILAGFISKLNLQNGEGTDSLVQKYSGEVDDTHYGNTNTGESATVTLTTVLLN